MPYEKNNETLTLLVKQVLEDPNDPEIRDGASRGRLKESTLHGEVLREADKIWEAVTSDISEHDAQEAALLAKQSDIGTKLGAAPTDERWRYDKSAPAWMLVVAMYGVIIAVIVLIYRYGFVGVFDKLRAREGWLWVGAAVTVLGYWVGTYFLIARRRERIRERAGEDWSQANAAWQEKKSEMEASAGIAAMGERITLAKQNIERALLEKSIKPRLRTLVNSNLTPSYAPHLGIGEARGLGEVFNPDFTIGTDAKESLHYKLDNMPGGSIGIAGPRGAGKSTLLRLFCGPRRIFQKNKEQKDVMAVLVSAPVAYQARDFILYLFSSVCQGVLEKEGEPYTRPLLQASAQSGQSVPAPLLKLLKGAPRPLYKVGVSLVAASLLLALLLTLADAGAGATSPNAAADAPPRDAAQGAAQTSGRSVEATPAAPPAPRSKLGFALSATVAVFANFVKMLGLKPGTLLMWGVFCVAAGLILNSLLFEGEPGALLKGKLVARLEEFVSPALGRARRARKEEHARREAEDEASKRAALTGLKGEALEWLRAIKFQQSYTSGWSGALKLPVGLEGGYSSAVTLAENQLSLPEIVHAFTKFLEATSQKYQVIIGIDELDKLESDEKAQRFLNDIKSIFGLERCFFLISVSENAMSSFERRGLPFRDVFDSSFDVIIYVDYLNFEAAKSLLEQRVVGRPVLFFGLSYCMSGGLARDLIRNFRSVMELRQARPLENDLETLCRGIVCADVKAKIRAMAISAKKIELEDEVDEFLEKLYQLESDLPSADCLLKTAQGIFKGQSGAAAGADKDDERKRETLDGLRDELATYVYYSSTVLQFFNNDLGEAQVTNPPRGGSLDNLAKARQVLGVNPSITRSMLATFRAVHGLNSSPTWDLPGTRAGAAPEISAGNSPS